MLGHIGWHRVSYLKLRRDLHQCFLGSVYSDWLKLFYYLEKIIFHLDWLLMKNSIRNSIPIGPNPKFFRIGSRSEHNNFFGSDLCSEFSSRSVSGRNFGWNIKFLSGSGKDGNSPVCNNVWHCEKPNEKKGNTLFSVSFNAHNPNNGRYLSKSSFQWYYALNKSFTFDCITFAFNLN